MVPANQNKTICNYCGTPFLINQPPSPTPSASANNYLALAKTAQESDNYDEAYLYFTKVLELEPENSAAWYGKGEVTGWLSTISNPRIDEASQYFKKALNFADPEGQDLILKNGSMQLILVCSAYMAKTIEVFRESTKQLLVDITSGLIIDYRYNELVDGQVQILMKRITSPRKRISLSLKNIADCSLLTRELESIIESVAELVLDSDPKNQSDWRAFVSECKRALRSSNANTNSNSENTLRSLTKRLKSNG